MSFRSARKARERFLQLARRARGICSVILEVHENAGVNLPRKRGRPIEYPFQPQRAAHEPEMWNTCVALPGFFLISASPIHGLPSMGRGPQPIPTLPLILRASRLLRLGGRQRLWIGKVAG